MYGTLSLYSQLCEGKMIRLIPGRRNDLDDFIKSFRNCQLGEYYFSSEKDMKNGYTEVGCIPDLYRDGTNEYLMMKVL